MVVVAVGGTRRCKSPSLPACLLEGERCGEAQHAWGFVSTRRMWRAATIEAASLCRTPPEITFSLRNGRAETKEGTKVHVIMRNVNTESKCFGKNLFLLYIN